MTVHSATVPGNQLMTAEDPCFECGAPARHDHHVVPRCMGGSKTVRLCAVCHSRAHGGSQFVRLQTLARKGLELRRARGLQSNGGARFGYRWEKGDIVPNEKEQALIARARDLRAQGLSWRKIAAQMEAEGWRGRTGRPIPNGKLWEHAHHSEKRAA